LGQYDALGPEPPFDAAPGVGCSFPEAAVRAWVQHFGTANVRYTDFPTDPVPL
jgi:hypothetical protein